ncbi:MAG: hypothetical protein WCF95_01085 [bacterium]
MKVKIKNFAILKTKAAQKISGRHAKSFIDNITNLIHSLKVMVDVDFCFG